MSTLRPPEALVAQVKADLRPVRPLPRPARRAMNVALCGAVLFLLVPSLHPLRDDAPDLGRWLLWGAAGAEALAGMLLAALALREAVPGGGIGPVRTSLALTVGAATQVAAGLWTWMNTVSARADLAQHKGPACFTIQQLLGLPVLLLAFWLVQRALPVRPRWSGALAGMSAGLLADGVWHLICPRSDLPHVLVWHGGATALTTAAGWLLGALYERRALRRFAERDQLA